MIWDQRRWLLVYDDGTLSVHVDRITGCSVLVDHLQLIACRRPLRRQLRQRWKQMKRVAFDAKDAKRAAAAGSRSVYSTVLLATP